MKACHGVSIFGKVLCAVALMVSTGAYAEMKIIKSNGPCTTEECIGDTVVVTPSPANGDPGSIGGPPSAPSNPVPSGHGIGGPPGGNVHTGAGGGLNDPTHTAPGKGGNQNPAGNLPGTTPVTPPTTTAGPTPEEKKLQKCAKYVVYTKQHHYLCYDNPVKPATVYSCQGAKVSASKPTSVYCTDNHVHPWAPIGSCGWSDWSGTIGCGIDLNE